MMSPKLGKDGFGMTRDDAHSRTHFSGLSDAVYVFLKKMFAALCKNLCL